MALWDVQDRLRHPNDLNMPFGFKKKALIKDGKDQWIHSKNTIQYPSAHITNKIYNANDLKSPLDRENKPCFKVWYSIIISAQIPRLVLTKIY